MSNVALVTLIYFCNNKELKVFFGCYKNFMKKLWKSWFLGRFRPWKVSNSFFTFFGFSNDTFNDVWLNIRILNKFQLDISRQRDYQWEQQKFLLNYIVEINLFRVDNANGSCLKMNYPKAVTLKSSNLNKVTKSSEIEISSTNVFIDSSISIWNLISLHRKAIVHKSFNVLDTHNFSRLFYIKVCPQTIVRKF